MKGPHCTKKEQPGFLVAVDTIAFRPRCVCAECEVEINYTHNSGNQSYSSVL